MCSSFNAQFLPTSKMSFRYKTVDFEHITDSCYQNYFYNYANCIKSVGNKIFSSSSIFSLGSVASPLVNFWMLGRHGCLKTRFLACLTAFYSSSVDVHASALESRYAFFLTFAITRPFSARTNLNASQVSSVPSFFQIFFNLLALI